LTKKKKVITAKSLDSGIKRPVAQAKNTPE